MTDQNTPDAKTDEIEVPKARTLFEFLGAKQPVKSFLASLESGYAKVPEDPSQWDELVESLGEDSSRAGRFSELVRAGVAEETPGRVRKVLTIAGSKFVRAQDKALANWGLIGTASAETDLGMLARQVRKARGSKDKALMVRAEQALSIGLAILSVRPDFDVVGALTILARQLFSEPLESRLAEKNVQKALRRATTKNLETFAAISSSHAGALEDCRKRFASATVELQTSRDQVKEYRDAKTAAEAQIARLNQQVAQLQNEVLQLSGRIAGVKGGAADDLTRVKARSRQFYQAKILDVLSTADEALNLDPPSVRVARERVRDVISDVRKEVEWLDQS